MKVRVVSIIVDLLWLKDSFVSILGVLTTDFKTSLGVIDSGFQPLYDQIKVELAVSPLST